MARAAPPLTVLAEFVAVCAVAGLLLAVVVTPGIEAADAGTRSAVALVEDPGARLAVPRLAQPTRLYGSDRSGRPVLLASFYDQDRRVVGWNGIAPAVKAATVAAEDVRFYSHGGVDVRAVARALLADLRHEPIQGASTITEQYVKNICVQQAEALPDPARAARAYGACVAPTLGRKLQEMRSAIALEKHESKRRILLGYLNIAGFGGRVYGIEAAAEHYFGVPAARLSVAQAASLVAILNDPERFRLDVPARLAANRVRRDYILAVERRTGAISRKEYTAAVRTPVTPHIVDLPSGCQDASGAGFFCEYVADLVLQDPAFGRTAQQRRAALYRGGLTVRTTLNTDLEATAQRVMNASVPQSDPRFAVGAAADSVEVGTGRVLAMVQNKHFDDSAAAAARGPAYTAVNYSADQRFGASLGMQPGSTFKLFTLLQWLAHGHTLSDVVPVSGGVLPAASFRSCGKPASGAAWDLHNNGRETGARTVYQATVSSINGGFASMARRLDLCDIRDTAEAFGVHPASGGRLSDVPASIIGQASSIAPLTMTAAYAAMGDEGRYCAPVLIDGVTGPDGRPRPVPARSCRQAVDPQVAIAADVALRGVLANGTGAEDQTADGVYEVGKTGTTDNNANTWMIGTSSRVATGVWVGNVSGDQDLSRIHDFPYCPVKFTSGAEYSRHCVWRGIESAADGIYGGAASFPAPEQRFLGNGPLPG